MKSVRVDEWDKYRIPYSSFVESTVHVGWIEQYLSERWIEFFEQAVSEALELGVI